MHGDNRRAPLVGQKESKLVQLIKFVRGQIDREKGLQATEKTEAYMIGYDHPKAKIPNAFLDTT